jgi:hypothetical protein
MLKWMCVAAAAMAMAAPAFAQDLETDLPDRPAKQTTPFDTAAMKEGNSLLKANGVCNAQYIISALGKAKNITVDCTHPEMAPYVVRTIETGVWDAEVFDGYFFDTEAPTRQQFAYGTGAPAVDPRGEKSPVMKTAIEARLLNNAMQKIDKDGACDVKFTVGADGAPKDIQPNCTPDAFNDPISKAIAEMEFTPAQKGGQPTDWPGMSMPLKLTRPK